jgi:hypothetical protein
LKRDNVSSVASLALSARQWWALARDMTATAAVVAIPNSVLAWLARATDSLERDPQRNCAADQEWPLSDAEDHDN